MSEQRTYYQSQGKGASVADDTLTSDSEDDTETLPPDKYRRRTILVCFSLSIKPIFIDLFLSRKMSAFPVIS